MSFELKVIVVTTTGNGDRNTGLLLEQSNFAAKTYLERIALPVKTKAGQMFYEPKNSTGRFFRLDITRLS